MCLTCFPPKQRGHLVVVLLITVNCMFILQVCSTAYFHITELCIGYYWYSVAVCLFHVGKYIISE